MSLRPNLHCLSPDEYRDEFANSSDRALDWSKISFIKRKGVPPDFMYHGKRYGYGIFLKVLHFLIFMLSFIVFKIGS